MNPAARSLLQRIVQAPRPPGTQPLRAEGDTPADAR